jgi:hypothetical protein
MKEAAFLLLALSLLLPTSARAIWYNGKWFDSVEEYREYKSYHDPVRQRSHLHPEQRREYERRFQKWYRHKYRDEMRRGCPGGPRSVYPYHYRR